MKSVSLWQSIKLSLSKYNRALKKSGEGGKKKEQGKHFHLGIANPKIFH
jgi:hypothetical protein